MERIARGVKPPAAEMTVAMLGRYAASGSIAPESPFMHRRTMLVFVALLAFQETLVAQSPQQATLPKLPAGAGKIDDDAPKTFMETPSKLRYRVLRKGTGKAPKPTSVVKVHYHGWLDDGKVFDSSYQSREMAEFPLNRVIDGWTEGLQQVEEGGMIELEIPADLGYGAGGAPPDIPPGATLHFLVELIEVR